MHHELAYVQCKGGTHTRNYNIMRNDRKDFVDLKGQYQSILYYVITIVKANYDRYSIALIYNTNEYLDLPS